MRIDHVVYAVRDLDEASARLLDRHGLRSIPGGVHPAWGTGNRLIPLGSDYVELLAVVDPQRAATTALGAALLERTVDRDGWFAVCLADDEIEATATRLGLRLDPGSRTRPDGRTVSWVGAGIEDHRRTPDLPFFITWRVPPGLHPGADPPSHPSGATAIAWVEIAGDRHAFEDWVGPHGLPVRFVAAASAGIARVGLASPGGDVVLA